VQVGIGEQRAHEREVGDRVVANRDRDVATDPRAWSDFDVGTRERPSRGAQGSAGLAVDAGGTRGFARSVHDAQLVADDQPDLHDRERGEDDEREQERELDGRLAALARESRAPDVPAPRSPA
jgi:hypothetical protein